MIDRNSMEPKTKFIANGPNKRYWIGALIMLSAASLVMLPIFIYGFPRGSDLGFHFRWNYYFAEELRQGNLYPRWLSGANQGYGSPLTLYYPPLQFYVTAAIDFLVHDTWRAMMGACWVATALSGLTMYRFSRTLLSRGLSLVASLLYMWAPYHFLDLYRGSSLSQYWSAVWIPLVLCAIQRVAAGVGWRAVSYLAFSYGLLCLTHVPVAFATTLIVPLYVLILTRNRRHLLQVATGFALGFGISAIFMSSVLLERHYVTLNVALEHQFGDCFLFEHLNELKKIDLFSNAEYPGLEGYLIEIDLAVVGLTLLWVLSSLILWKARKDAEPGSGKNPLLVALWAVVTLSLFLTTRASTFVWRNLPFLEYMQCPDRWLVITVTGMCLLVAAAAYAILQSRKYRILKGVLLAVAVMLNVFISAHISTRHQASPERLWDRVRKLKEAPQYTPIWWNREWQDEFENASAVVSSGDATVTALNDTGARPTYGLSANTESVIKLRTLYFPGWIARMDGKPVPIDPGEEGHIQLAIPPGEHTLTLRFEDTWQRTAGKIASALSLITSLAMLYLTRRRRPPAVVPPEG